MRIWSERWDAAADPETGRGADPLLPGRPGGYGEGDIFVGVKLSALRGHTARVVEEPFVADHWLPLCAARSRARLAALV